MYGKTMVGALSVMAMAVGLTIGSAQAEPALENPYQDMASGIKLRGNLHAHSTRSDGARGPQVVIDDYASRGYGFLMLSDHDTVSSNEFLATLDAKGMVLIPGNEISAGGSHLLHVDASQKIEPVTNRQAILDSIKASGGFAIMNHPNWHGTFNHAPIEQLREWKGYLGMEIYNGVIGRLDGSPYALEKWDMLLTDGRRVWGFANDDSHVAGADVELGWSVAYVKEKTVKAVVDALRKGCFYASTGVEIKSIDVKGMHIRVEAPNAQRIVAFQRTGNRLKTVDGPVLEVDVPTNAVYARIQCWGEGEKMAWTQPFYVSGQ